MQDNRGYFCGMQGERIFHFDGKDASEIYISDIARSLCRTDRYNGHGRVFWNVASHTLLCMNLSEVIYPGDDNMRFEMLCHDFEETYVGDVIAPMKRALYPHYHSFLEPVRQAVRVAFGLEGEYPEDAREIDTLASWLETRYLFSEQTWAHTWGQAIPFIPPQLRTAINIPLLVHKFARLPFDAAISEFKRVIAWEISLRLSVSLDEIESQISGV